MKKLLGIVVLGLLLSNCGTTPEQKQRAQEIKTKNQEIFNIQMQDARLEAEKLTSKGIDIITVSRSTWTGFNKLEAANKCGQKGKFYHYFPLTTKLESFRKSFVYNSNTLIAYCSSEKLLSDPLYGINPMYTDTGYWYSYKRNPISMTNFNPSVAQSIKNNQVKPVEESKELLVNIKNTCMEFGYKEGTETLANCMKDLYLKQNQMQTQSLSQTTITAKPKRKIDPSVWDDLLNISKGMSEGKTFTESLGGVSSSNSTRKITCFKTGEETGGLNKICRYDCVGNLVTTTVGAAQMCPIQIQR